jgi:hypothetical protein
VHDAHQDNKEPKRVPELHRLVADDWNLGTGDNTRECEAGAAPSHAAAFLLPTTVACAGTELAGDERFVRLIIRTHTDRLPNHNTGRIWGGVGLAALGSRH